MIKNSDIETLYNRISTRFDLVGSYTGDPDLLPKIMKACRLKPYSIFSGDFQSRFIFEPHWVDEFGNSLKIDNKLIKIVVNDLQITKNAKISTDLFFGHSIQKIADYSVCAMVINCDKCDFISFCGRDNYLRTFIIKNTICQISSLLLGIDSLREFYKNKNTVLNKEIDKNKLNLLIKVKILNYIICWQPSAWKNYVRSFR